MRVVCYLVWPVSNNLIRILREDKVEKSLSLDQEEKITQISINYIYYWKKPKRSV